ncbi:aldehyde dehydrogenase family protein [Nocardia flavorosea]|uniref:Aldehyde dehydrogenase n=1 Tax=Nocardia flavorosea TaxID=53429 RepID=A0A846YKB0_9NOCA|nr:aldehyde dehydrogenase family protein [Nocardia flavorosea]NKY57329.1 aldehyde dehydrogenase [Nocardia flavorosea]
MTRTLEPAATPADIIVVSPTSGDTVATLPSATTAEVDAAIARARGAQREWWGMTSDARSKVLWRWSELLDEHAEELATLDARCTGKVIRDGLSEVRTAARYARYWAGQTDKLFGDQLNDVPGRLSYTLREPLGVFGVIIPWNAPCLGSVSRTLPPLGCGNAVIVKPSEFSPLSALRNAELAREAGMPEHLYQVVVGAGDIGAHLAAHPGVDGISFTGSVETGRKVNIAAAATFKRTTLELGGKSPVIVFPDADLDEAALGVLIGILMNAGQICAANSRLLVHESVAEEFTAKLLERAQRVEVGDPLDPRTQVGPVVCRRQYDKVMDFIASAEAEGATIAVGGGRPLHLSEDRGLFIAPTIITNVRPDMRVSREEVFGPVLGVSTFATEEEAIELANDSEFGLSSYVWTTDGARLHRMAERIESGVVHGNTYLVMDVQLPFGGFKNSGVSNAFGNEAIEACTQVKRVTVRTGAGPLPSPWPGV